MASQRGWISIRIITSLLLFVTGVYGSSDPFQCDTICLDRRHPFTVATFLATHRRLGLNIFVLLTLS